MKKKYIIFIIILYIILVINFFPDYVFSPDNEGEKLQTDNKEIYYGSEKINLSTLNDPLFADNEYSYSHKLAIKSLSMAEAAFSANSSELNWGENSNVHREDNIDEFLTSNGFSNLSFHDYDKSLNDTSSKVAFAIGQKVYNHDTDIIAIAIRGGDYGLEWADNFNVGNSDNPYHKGFYAAASKVKNTVDKYITQSAHNKNVKLWISGYSRGGAVANILASMYDRNKTEFPCQVYAYTFASPKVTVIDDTMSHDTIYRNIFNILSPNDPVYNIPPDKWGFGRFGICVIFPDNNDSTYENAEEIKRNVEESYFSYTGRSLVTPSNNINSFINLIINSSESRNFFADNLAVPISDLIVVKMSKYKNQNGIWQNYTSDDILKEIHGERGVNELKKIKSSDFFVAMKKLGIKFPDDFYTFITLCHLNGFTQYEEIIFSNISANDLNDISKISSAEYNNVGHQNVFYRSWLENVPISALKFAKE